MNLWLFNFIKNVTNRNICIPDDIMIPVSKLNLKVVHLQRTLCSFFLSEGAIVFFLKFSKWDKRTSQMIHLWQVALKLFANYKTTKLFSWFFVRISAMINYHFWLKWMFIINLLQYTVLIIQIGRSLLKRAVQQITIERNYILQLYLFLFISEE